MDRAPGAPRQAEALPAGARARLGSRHRPEAPLILRFIVRILAFAAIVMWTLLMVGAFQALVETGRVLGTIDFDLGMPEVEAELLNLMLLLERAGPIGIFVTWIAGVLAILLARAILLGLLRLVWLAIAIRPRPASRPRPAGQASPVPPAAPARAGPWARQPRAPVAAPAPPAVPRRPSVPPSPASADKPDRPPPRPAGSSVVDRGLRVLARGGTVVLKRPRGHMDGP